MPTNRFFQAAFIEIHERTPAAFHRLLILSPAASTARQAQRILWRMPVQTARTSPDWIERETAREVTQVSSGELIFDGRRLRIRAHAGASEGLRVGGMGVREWWGRRGEVGGRGGGGGEAWRYGGRQPQQLNRRPSIAAFIAKRHANPNSGS